MNSAKNIVTVEGLAAEGKLHPVQAAMIRNDVCSAVAVIREGHASSDDEIREWMSGNVCRCGCYLGIVEAVKEARNA